MSDRRSDASGGEEPADMVTSARRELTSGPQAKWLILTAVSLGNLVAKVESTALLVSLPTVSREFASNLDLTAWLVLAYSLLEGTLLLSFASLSDRIGKRPVFAGGLLVLTLGSILAALASFTLEALVVYRALQGLGAAMVLSNGAALVTSAFPDSERGKALGFYSISWTVGASVGPALGGILTSLFGWRSIFVSVLPICFLSLFAGYRYIPRESRLASSGRFDFGGSVAFLVGFGAFLLSLTVGQQEGWLSTRTLSLALLAVTSGVGFILVERRTGNPILELRLFRFRPFWVSNFGRTMYFLIVGIVEFLLPFYFVGVWGYAPLQLGILLAIFSGLTAIAGPVSGWLSDKVGPRPLVVIGVGVTAGALLGLDLTILVIGSGFLAVGWFAAFAVGKALFVVPNNSVIFGSAPQTHRGLASGLLSTTWNLGYGVGVALASISFLTSVPAELRPTASALISGDTLQISGSQMVSVVVAFRSAFVLATVVAGLSLLLYLAMLTSSTPAKDTSVTSRMPLPPSSPSRKTFTRPPESATGDDSEKAAARGYANAKPNTLTVRRYSSEMGQHHHTDLLTASGDPAEKPLAARSSSDRPNVAGKARVLRI